MLNEELVRAAYEAALMGKDAFIKWYQGLSEADGAAFRASIPDDLMPMLLAVLHSEREQRRKPGTLMDQAYAAAMKGEKAFRDWYGQLEPEWAERFLAVLHHEGARSTVIALAMEMCFGSLSSFKQAEDDLPVKPPPDGFRYN